MSSAQGHDVDHDGFWAAGQHMHDKTLFLDVSGRLSPWGLASVLMEE